MSGQIEKILGAEADRPLPFFDVPSTLQPCSHRDRAAYQNLQYQQSGFLFCRHVNAV